VKEEAEKKMGMSKRKPLQMISLCHLEETVEGAEHNFGKQYCPKCNNPCYWNYA